MSEYWRSCQDASELLLKPPAEDMRRFFLAYQERMPIAQSETGQALTVRRKEAEIAQSQTGPLAAKARPFRLSWTHDVFLLGIKNPDERSFYEIESADQNWILRELRRQFDSGLYERLALSRDKKRVRRLAREGQIAAQRCQHPRAGVPAISAQQRRTPAQAARMGAGGGA